MGELVNLLMQRCDATIPWGFTVKLENGCGHTLKVNRVTPGTIASNYLKSGDVIVKLSNKVAKELAKCDLDQVIKQAGNALEIIIQKKPPGSSGQATPVTPPTPLYSGPNYGPPTPPVRNPSYMSPNYSYSPTGNSSPTPYSPQTPPNFPQVPTSPSTCPAPPPPPMPRGPGSPAGQAAPASPAPPPPPPPPPMPTGQTGVPWRQRQQNQCEESRSSPARSAPQNLHVRTPSSGPVNQYDNLPAALQNTLSKDKKPFTYTPGGIDLSELRSPRMQRRLQYNQMDPPKNIARQPQPPPEEPLVPQGPPPPETYPQPRVQLLPAIGSQKMVNAPNRAPTTSNKGWNVNAQKMSPTGQDRPASPKVSQPERAPAYVHSLYNTPLGLYSPENVAEAFQAQTGEVLPEFENLNLNNPQPQPQYSTPQVQKQPKQQKQQKQKQPKHQQEQQPQQQNYSAKEEEGFTPYYKEQHPQSRSFRLLQVMTDTTANTDEEGNETNGRNSQYEEDEMKFTGIKRNPIPSRAFQTLQKITGDEENDRSPSQPRAPQPPPQQQQQYQQQQQQYQQQQYQQQQQQLQQQQYQQQQEQLQQQQYQQQQYQQQQQYLYQQRQQQQQQPAREANSSGPEDPELRYRGAYIPSRSFKLLQSMTGGSEEELAATKTRSPKKTSTMNIQVGNGPSNYNNYYTQEPEQPQGPWVPPSEQQAEAEPKKYMGGHIPSRSFRMLQAMTGGDDPDSGNESIEIPVIHERSQPQQESEPRMYMGGHIPSRSFRILQAMTDPNRGE